MSYRYMRLLLFFDLPMQSSQEKKIYRKFHSLLQNEGWMMLQFSVYSKIVLNSTVAKGVIKKITDGRPENGIVTILTITEKQFARMAYITGNPSNRVGNLDSRLILLEEEGKIDVY